MGHPEHIPAKTCLDIIKFTARCHRLNEFDSKIHIKWSIFVFFLLTLNRQNLGQHFYICRTRWMHYIHFVVFWVSRQ